MKTKSSLAFIGILVAMIAASLLTVLTLYITGVIFTDPIELVYRVEDEVKVYDGTPLTPKRYVLESGELLKGHRAQVTTVGEQTDAGVSVGTLSVAVYDEDGFDVTRQYSINAGSCSLYVRPASIVVNLPGQQVTYNGKTVLFDNYSLISGSLAEGHKLGAAPGNTKVVNVGDMLPDLTPVVFDEKNRDVSYNYEIDSLIGIMEVVPRRITVKPVDVQKTYDGMPLTCTRYEILSGSLVEGQNAEFSIVNALDDSEASMIGAGAMLTKLNSFKITEQNGHSNRDVSSNYSLNCDTQGVLEILKRPATVITGSVSREYNGDELSCDTVTAHNILTGHTVSAPATVPAIRNVGTVSNQFDCIIKDSGETDVTVNYAISPQYGTLEVIKKPLTIALENVIDEYTYNGTEQKPSLNQALNVAEWNSFFSWDDLDAAYQVATYTPAINAGSYNYTLEPKKSSTTPPQPEDPINPITNYDLSFTSATFNIKKAVGTPSYTGAALTKVYDGKPVEELLNAEDFSFSATITAGGTFTVAGLVYSGAHRTGGAGSTLTIASARIYLDGNDVTENFNVNWSACNIAYTITARRANVSYATYEHDGTDYPTVSEIAMKRSILLGKTTIIPVAGDYVQDVSLSYRISGGRCTGFYVAGAVIFNAYGENVTEYYIFDNNVYGAITHQ